LSSALATSTFDSYPTTHDEIKDIVNTQNFLDNQFVDSKATQWLDLYDPATNNLVTRVPQSTDEELVAAVDSAAKAFPAWRDTSLLARQQIMFKYVALIRQHWDRLAAAITLEQGKTFGDAKGDVLRGLQVAETACGITSQLTGEVLEVSKDMETRQYREPLGVVAAICPFSKHCSKPFDICRVLMKNFRFPCHDSSLVHSSGNHDRKHHCHQAFRA
jgi:malonate-semialdehyde dehydrogenase (acetylating)/methylmalonate-semialdehyde dehydrogenase